MSAKFDLIKGQSINKNDTDFVTWGQLIDFIENNEKLFEKPVEIKTSFQKVHTKRLNDHDSELKKYYQRLERHLDETFDLELGDSNVTNDTNIDSWVERVNCVLQEVKQKILDFDLKYQNIEEEVKYNVSILPVSFPTMFDNTFLVSHRNSILASSSLSCFYSRISILLSKRVIDRDSEMLIFNGTKFSSKGYNEPDFFHNFLIALPIEYRLSMDDVDVRRVASLSLDQLELISTINLHLEPTQKKKFVSDGGRTWTLADAEITNE